ncbi:MAG: hypothetical protein VB032_06140, partial [Burkholderiaceae bacterium]|nr:hypothetical protein [Burkholderiaceae bacterium]
MINGLGGGSGFGENDYVRADDPMQSTGIDITGIFGASGVKFGSNFYTTLYINNNGMVTFGSGYSGFTPNGLSAGVNSGGGLLPAIALYWTDLDTRTVTVPVSAGGTSTGTNLVHWDVDTVNKKITITWDDVGEFSYGTTSKLAGQIILSDAGSGNMDIEFRYEYVVPLDSHTATAGWNVGVASGTAGVDYYEIPIASGTTSPNDVLADLDTRAGNTGLDGIWRFFLRDGSVLNADLSYSPTTFAESTANDGSISTVSTLTLVGDTFTGANGVMDVADYSVSNLPAGLTAVITKTSSTTATLTLTGNAAAHANANDINNLTVTFNNAAFVGNNASAIPGTTQNLIIDFAADSNHAPTALGDLTLAAVNEDTAAPAGAAISSLAGLAFTDVDGAGTLGGVAVVSNAADANTQGIWQYSTDAGAHWSIIGTVSGSEALALAASTLLRFVPVANYNGTPTGLTVHAMDDSANFFSSSGATESRVTVDASLSGGTTAIATATNTIGTSITAVNDAPVITGSGGSVVFTEGANVASTPVAVHTG